MVFKQILIFILCSLSIKSIAQKTFHLDSPSGEMRLTVTVSDSISYSIYRGQQTVITESNIALLTSVGNLGVDLSFLGSGNCEASVCEDGVNAAKYGSDYRLRTEKIDASKKLKVSMAPGGGYVAKIRRDDL